MMMGLMVGALQAFNGNNKGNGFATRRPAIHDNSSSGSGSDVTDSSYETRMLRLGKLKRKRSKRKKDNKPTEVVELDSNTNDSDISDSSDDSMNKKPTAK